MGTVSKTTVGRNVVWVDADEPQRWLDAYGPDVHKVIEEFVDLPMLAAATPAAYTTTAVGTSTAALVGGALGGNLLITTGGTENNGLQMQALGEAFLPTDSNKLYFGIKFQIDSATQSDFLVGLAITNTAVLGGVTDGMYFRKVDETTTCNFVLETGSSESETAALTVVAATDYILEWCWDGAAITFYVDGVLTGTPAITKMPTAEYMTPTIAFLTGSGAAITMTVSWMRAIQLM